MTYLFNSSHLYRMTCCERRCEGIGRGQWASRTAILWQQFWVTSGPIVGRYDMISLCPTFSSLFLSEEMTSAQTSIMLPYEPVSVYDTQKAFSRFILKMPRVVAEQKSKFETDELFRRHSRESEVCTKTPHVILIPVLGHYNDSLFFFLTLSPCPPAPPVEFPFKRPDSKFRFRFMDWCSYNRPRITGKGI